MLGKRLINSNSAAAGGSCTTDTLQILGDTSCIAYYKMSDATDESGNYDGTATNVNFNVAGKFGFAGAFNGSSSSIVTTLNVNGFSQITLSCWIKTTSTGGNDHIISANDGSNWCFLSMTSGIVSFGASNGGSGIFLATHTGAINDGDWHHICGTYNGTNAILYIDGTGHTPVSATASLSVNVAFGIGYRNTAFPSGTYYSGKIDQVRIFNKALSSTEVTTLYNEVYCVPTIVPTDHFNPVIYTGNAGASNTTSQSITSVGFKPDLVWVKNRDNGNNNVLFDSIRASTNWLNSNNSNQEYSNSSTADASFLSNGFTTGKSDQTNRSGDGIVSWNWKAGGSSNTFNKNGTGYGTASAAGLTGESNITIQGSSVNTESGISIIKTLTSPSTGMVIPHGLGTQPELIISKPLNSSLGWYTWTPILDNGSTSSNTGWKGLFLDTTAAASSSAYVYASNTHIYDSWAVGRLMVYYSFISIAGYSKIGSYVGTGAAGNSIVTGFRPAFVMVKTTNTNSSWFILDNKRNVDNPRNSYLMPDSSSATVNAGSGINFLSNGFQFTGVAFNDSGNSWIFMAIAEEVLVPDNFFNDDSTLATYKLNGDAGDDSGNGYNGTASNVTYATGKFDEAAVFNGTTSKIDISSPISTTSDQDFSFSQWVNFDTLPTGGSFIGIWGSDTGAVPTTRFLIRQVSGGYRYEVLRAFNSTYYYNSTAMPVSSLSTSVWYNIVFTYTSSTKTVHIYLNGVELGTGVVLSTSGSSATSTGLSMGRYNSTNLYGLDGKLDNVRIFDRALSSAEVTQLYNE